MTTIKIYKFKELDFKFAEFLLYNVDWFMVLNATFNNISVISWQSVLLMEETGVPGENYQPAISH